MLIATCSAVALLLWLALAPLHSASRQRLLAIGAAEATMPSTITLTLGLQDVLLLHNRGSVALRFGPVLLAPGQQFQWPFEQAGVYPVAASAWAGGRLTVTVVELPAPGWERLIWRLAAFNDTLRNWPMLPPPRAR